MATTPLELQHAALWLIGPDMPGLLRLGAEYVFKRGGNIDKDIADKFGEKAVVFMSITAHPADIERMEADKEQLKAASGCGVVFQPMKEPTIPPGFREELHGFDMVTDDVPGLIAEITRLLAEYGILVVGHIGERRSLPGPRQRPQGGQKFVVLLPVEFDQHAFARDIDALAHKHNGTMKTPLRTVPGLLWWW